MGIYDKCLNVELIGAGAVYGDLPFPGTGCPVWDVGLDFFIDVYHMLKMIDTI